MANNVELEENFGIRPPCSAVKRGCINYGVYFMDIFPLLQSVVRIQIKEVR